jgi:hypothetical protein
MPIKTIPRFHLTPVRRTIFKGNNSNKCWWGCSKTGTFIHCWSNFNTHKISTFPEKGGNGSLALRFLQFLSSNSFYLNNYKNLLHS